MKLVDLSGQAEDSSNFRSSSEAAVKCGQFLTSGHWKGKQKPRKKTVDFSTLKNTPQMLLAKTDGKDLLVDGSLRR